MEKSKDAAELALIVVQRGNKNSLSDAGVAGITAGTAAEGALYNVMINIEGIEDEAFKKRMITQAIQINAEIQKTVKKIKKILEKELKISV